MLEISEINSIFKVLLFKTNKCYHLSKELPVYMMVFKRHSLIGEFTNIHKEHAELIAARSLDLRDSDIFINLEPCVMCAHRLSLEKINSLYFASENLISGGLRTKINLFRFLDRSYKFPVFGGFYSEEFSPYFKDFFKQKRYSKA